MLKQETLNYLLKRQRKSILQECRTIAVIGASPDPQSTSYVQIEKLLGFGLAIHPILPGCRRFLGITCYDNLTSVPGSIDIVLVFPNHQLDLHEIASQACEKGVGAFWVEEEDLNAETKLLLAQANVQIVEHESLTAGYARHFPFVAGPAGPSRPKQRKTVAESMSRHPVTLQRTDKVEEALERMKVGHFRHLPVVDEEGRLIGILSDRDLRLILPHLAFGSSADTDRQIRSTPVEQVAFFDPVTVSPEDTLERAAGTMLRWNVGALPVVRNENALTGIITYTDILREFVARGESKAGAQ
jgi:CBS domain-containing protein